MDRFASRRAIRQEEDEQTDRAAKKLELEFAALKETYEEALREVADWEKPCEEA